jgi:aminocarboxymuconate-semialdehyde decarboxylase
VIVDVHAHVVPRSLPAELESGPVSGLAAARTDSGWAVTVPGAEPARPIGPWMTDLAPRRAWMERTGVTPYGARDRAWRPNDAMAEPVRTVLGGDAASVLRRR